MLAMRCLHISSGMKSSAILYCLAKSIKLKNDRLTLLMVCTIYVNILVICYCCNVMDELVFDRY